MSRPVERDALATRTAEPRRHAGVAPSVLRTAIALDALCIAALVAMPFWVFGRDSGRLGIYADDASFFVSLPDLSPTTLMTAIETYVTGRNLHIFWQYLVFALTGNTVDALPAQHWLQAGLVSLNCGASYLVFRLVGLPVLAGFLGAALFAFLPNHPDIYFWLTAIPQHLISTFLVLALLIGAVRTGRIARSGPRRHAGALLGVDLCILAAGLFTYDQASLLMITIFLGAAGTCFLVRADLRLTAALYAIAGVGIFVLWVAWKVLVPSFGPSLSHVSAFGLLRNFLFSLSLTAGPHFFRVFDQLPSILVSPEDCLVALVAALAFLVVGLICLQGADGRTGGTKDADPSDKIARWYPLVLPTGIAVFFILAYLPAYLWFISLRHTYLPSVAVAAGAAWLIWRLGEMLERQGGPQRARAGALVALLAVCGSTYFFVGIVLAEKRDWIWSYQARRQMYAELLQDPRFKAASTLILEDFPNSVRPMSAPLGYQMPGEPQVVTRGQARFKNLVQTSVPSRSGAFIGVDIDRDGDEAFLHVPEATIYHLYFKGLGSDRILYSRADERAAPPDYTLDADIANLSGQTEFRARRVTERPGAVEVTIPPVALEPNEVLAASPRSRTDHGLQRMTSPAAGGARRLVMVDLSAAESAETRRVTVLFGAQNDPVAKLQIYAVSEHGRRLIADVDVRDD